MKVILSRKGFDSSYGRMASPILPDASGNYEGGTLLSLPIPANPSQCKKETSIPYADLSCKLANGNSFYYDQILGMLSRYEGKKLTDEVILNQSPNCHLDPDIRENEYGREKDWRGLFGQSGAALSHLEDQGVKQGDDSLFLFFGWFRKSKWVDNKLRYADSINLHIIFGYLQVGTIISDKSQILEWMEYHPHAKYVCKDNVIYVAREKLSLDPSLPGYGCLTYNKDRILTKEEGKLTRRTHWNLDRLPNVELSYNTNPVVVSGDDKYFQSAPIGQEFVFKPKNKSEQECVEQWATNIIIGKSLD